MTGLSLYSDLRLPMIACINSLISENARCPLLLQDLSIDCQHVENVVQLVV